MNCPNICMMTMGIILSGGNCCCWLVEMKSKLSFSAVDKDDRYLVVTDNITTLYILESSIYSVWSTPNCESFPRSKKANFLESGLKFETFFYFGTYFVCSISCFSSLGFNGVMN